jgi:hypothetical protein
MAGILTRISLSMGFIVFAVLIAGLLGCLPLAFYPAYFAQDNSSAVVPVHRIPAYHIIQADDFTNKSLASDTLNDDAVGNISPYTKKDCSYITIEPLESDKPFSEDALFNIQNLTKLSRPTVMGIPATMATSLGGRIERGDVLELIVPGFKGRKQLMIEDIHVLDILGNASDNGSAQFTIVAVLPRESALQLINELHGDRASVIRDLGA